MCEDFFAEILAEKIAIINKVDAGDSTVSQVQSSFTLTDASIAKRGQLTPLRENETDEGTVDDFFRQFKIFQLGTAVFSIWLRFRNIKAFARTILLISTYP